MSKYTITSLEEQFGNMRDPRVVGGCDHKLMDITYYQKTRPNPIAPYAA